MKILVTGGAGYIGSHTSKALCQAGYEVVVLDNLSMGHRWAVQWGPLIHADLADAAALGSVFRDEGIEAVVHFAASTAVGESVLHPRRYYRNNVVNTLNLLEAMVDAGVGAIVFSSTCATYGDPIRIPIDEDHPQHPINPYGETKLTVERILNAFGSAYGIRSIALRYFNAAGADPDGQIGEDHTPESHLVPLVIEAALGRRPHLDVYGTDYPTPDGTAIRDYIHVSDLADAHVRALRYLLDKGSSTAINLGTGSGHSIREVIAAVETLSPLPITVRETERRSGDAPVLVADSTKAERILGWKPRYSDLASIVGTAFRWHSARGR
jgi:UDP-arabinose 4-epimerase